MLAPTCEETCSMPVQVHGACSFCRTMTCLYEIP